MGRRAATVGVGFLVATVAAVAIAAPAQARHRAHTAQTPHPSLALSLHPRNITGGQAVLITGHIRWGNTPTAEQQPLTVQLYKLPFPYNRRYLVRTATTAFQFAFTVHPDRDARYVAVLPSDGEHASTAVRVYPVTYVTARALPLGQAGITIVVFHPRDLLWGSRTVHWWFAGPGGGFHQVPDTRSFRLSPYVAVLHVRATLPAGGYRWRACFEAPDALALENPRRLPGCAGRGYYGSGSLPVGFPSPGAIARAEGYLASRGGDIGMAVVDSEGRLSGWNMYQQFITGSAVKAMLLVAYLRRLDAMGQHYVDSYSDSFLYPMIHVSDNNAATQCWSIVGNAGLFALAGAAGMTGFSMNSPSGSQWGAAMLTPRDQALFFFEQDSLIPPEFRGYARYLLSTIADYESWGIPAVARPLGYNVFFKAGWRPSPNTFLVHQIARLEGHGVTFSLAIMTDGDSGMGDGISKIEGTTHVLLGG